MIKSEMIKKANKMAKIFYSSSKKTKELVKATCAELIKTARDSFAKASEKKSTCVDKMIASPFMIITANYSV